jgi:Na+/phosphate symporter
VINRAQGENKNLLSNRFNELKQLNHEFHNHLKTHSVNTGAYEKYLKDASRYYDQLGTNNQQLLSEINRTITQMSDSFTHRENQLESNVAVLKDTLSRYVASLEGTLGEKLEKVSRNIGEYVVDINDAMKKEFKQIGEITEDNQQRSARYMQQTLNELSQEFQHLNRQLQSFSQDAIKQSYRVRVGTDD